MVKSHKNEMKRNFLFKGLLMLLLGGALGTPLLADTEVVNGIEWTYTISGDAARVGGGSTRSTAVPTTTTGAIVIPSELGGKKVTTIDHYAFYGCSSLTSVVIPEGVTNVWSYVFEGCSSLKSVVLPESVIDIGLDLFDGCDALPKDEKGVQYESENKRVLISAPSDLAGEYKIPNSVRFIHSYAFNGCSDLMSVVLPEGVMGIGFYAFRRCSRLTSVVLPEGVTEIGEQAFYECINLTLVIPESVTAIGRSAFDYVNTLVLRCDVLPYNDYVGDWWETDGGKVVFSKKYAANWQKELYGSNRNNYEEMVNYASAEVTAEMVTPKQMSVKYKVRDAKGDKVKVRAVAFLDGERSFENIVLVKTGENVPDGREVEVNKEHSFVWNVSDDWDADLVNVKIEILVQEGDLLPQDLMTIPANGEHKEMTITRNKLDYTDMFNALLWCYAEGDTALTLSSGVLKTNGTTICNGMSLSSNNTLMNYLYGKMGYKVLTGDDLTYAEKMTRLDLEGYGLNQVSVKIEE